MTNIQKIAQKITNEFLDGMRTDTLMDYLLAGGGTCDICSFNTPDESIIQEVDGIKYHCHCKLINHPNEDGNRHKSCAQGKREYFNTEVKE